MKDVKVLKEIKKGNKKNIIDNLVKIIFLKYAETWLNPDTVALSCYSENLPFTLDTIKNIRVKNVDTKRLLSKKQ